MKYSTCTAQPARHSTQRKLACRALPSALRAYVNSLHNWGLRTRPFQGQQHEILLRATRVGSRTRVGGRWRWGVGAVGGIVLVLESREARGGAAGIENMK